MHYLAIQLTFLLYLLISEGLLFNANKFVAINMNFHTMMPKHLHYCGRMASSALIHIDQQGRLNHGDKRN